MSILDSSLQFESGHTAEIVRCRDRVSVILTDAAGSVGLDLSRDEAARLANALAQAAWRPSLDAPSEKARP